MSTSVRLAITYTKKGTHYCGALGYIPEYLGNAGTHYGEGPVTFATLFTGAVMPSFLRIEHGLRDSGSIHYTSCIDIPVSTIMQAPQVDTDVPLPAIMDGSNGVKGNRVTLVIAPRSVQEPNGPAVHIGNIPMGRTGVASSRNPDFDYGAIDRMFQTYAPLIIHLWLDSKFSSSTQFQNELVTAYADKKKDGLAILTKNCKDRVFGHKQFTDVEKLNLSQPDPVVESMDVRQLELVTAYREKAEHRYQVAQSEVLLAARQTGFFYPVAGTMVNGRFREFDLLILSTDQYRLMLDPDDEVRLSIQNLKGQGGNTRREDYIVEAKYVEVPKAYLPYCRKALRVTLPDDPKSSPSSVTGNQRDIVALPIPQLSKATLDRSRYMTDRLRELDDNTNYHVSFHINQPVHPTTFNATLNAANLFVKFRQEPLSGPGTLANYIVRGLHPCRNHDVANHFPMVKVIKDTLVHRYSGKEEFQNLAQSLDEWFLKEYDQDQRRGDGSATLAVVGQEQDFHPQLPEGVNLAIYHRFMGEVGKLDYSQRELFLNMMNVPQGIHLCHGYPGSGKTSTTQLFLAACLAVPAPVDASCCIRKAPDERVDPSSTDPLDTSDDDRDQDHDPSVDGFVMQSDEELEDVSSLRANFEFWFKSQSQETYPEEAVCGLSDLPQPGNDDVGDYRPDPDEAPSPDHDPTPLRCRVPQIIYSGNTNLQCDHLAASLSARCKELGIAVTVTRYEGSIEKVIQSLDSSVQRLKEQRYKYDDDQLSHLAEDEALDFRQVREDAKKLLDEKRVNGVFTIKDRLMIKLAEEGPQLSKPWLKKVMESRVEKREDFISCIDEHFYMMLEHAIIEVIAKTDVLVCTGVRSRKLKEEHAEFFNPLIDIKEEAARETEATTLGTWACFPSTLLKILVGDPKQCGPVLLHAEAYKNKNKEDRFITPEQLYTSSLFERLQKLGCSSTIFRVNHRSKYRLAGFSSERVYGGDMEMIVGDDSPEESRRIKEFIREHFGMKEMMGHRLMVGTTDAHSSARGTGSVNVAHANFIANLVKEIHENNLTMNGERVSILVMSNYSAQVQEFKNAIAALNNPEIRRTTTIRTTFDSMSLDANIVISDFVRSRNAGVGFNGREHLMNVMTTRAKDFEIVFITDCLADAMKPDRDTQRLIYYFVKECRGIRAYRKMSLHGWERRREMDTARPRYTGQSRR